MTCAFEFLDLKKLTSGSEIAQLKFEIALPTTATYKPVCTSLTYFQTQYYPTSSFPVKTLNFFPKSLAPWIQSLKAVHSNSLLIISESLVRLPLCHVLTCQVPPLK